MPTLQWVGKDKVVNHHLDVPFRVLNKVSSFRAPEGTPANSTDNRIIHGDNLEALKTSANACCWPGPRACRACGMRGCMRWGSGRRGRRLRGSRPQPKQKIETTKMGHSILLGKR